MDANVGAQSRRSPSPPADLPKGASVAEIAETLGRARILTEKGKQYTINQRTNALNTAKRAWRKQLNHLEVQVITQRDIVTLQHDSELLEERMRDLFKAQEAVEEVVDAKEELKNLDDKFEQLAKENNNMLRQVGDRIRELESAILEGSSLHSSSSRRSRRSRKSSRSQTTDTSTSSFLRRRLGLEEDIATLKAKIALSQEKQAIEEHSKRILEEVERRKMEVLKDEERALQEIRSIKDSFKLKEELAQKEAVKGAVLKVEQEEGYSADIREDESQLPKEDGRGDQMEKFLDNLPELPAHALSAEPRIPTSDVPPINAAAPVVSRELDSCSPVYVPTGAQTSLKTPTSVTWSPQVLASNMPLHRAPNIVAGPASNLDNSDHAQLLEIARLLAENQSQSRLPLPEPGIFSGDLLQYPLWAEAFETLIESHAVKPCERLHFLGKYVKGDAKELVNGFLLLDSEDAYEKAKAMIAKRYGDPFAVADAYRKKIDSWSKSPRMMVLVSESTQTS